jgi:hypothetical protein
MKSPSGLFPALRHCVCCGASCLPRRRSCSFIGPNVLSITPLIYRWPMLRNAPTITVCEECLVRALTGSYSQDQEKLWQALRQSLSIRYNALLEGESR